MAKKHYGYLQRASYTEVRMEPPIQTEYESDVSSFCIQSVIPGNTVVPPERTIAIEIAMNIKITFEDSCT